MKLKKKEKEEYRLRKPKRKNEKKKNVAFITQTLKMHTNKSVL